MPKVRQKQRLRQMSESQAQISPASFKTLFAQSDVSRLAREIGDADRNLRLHACMISCMQDEVRGTGRGGELGRLITHVAATTGVAKEDIWSYLIWSEKGAQHDWHEDGHGPTQSPPG